MRESNLSPIPLLLLSGLAMVSGLGLLLFELITGVLHRSLPSMFLWGSYLVLLLTSVWGMKTWIELQTELWARYRRTLPGLPGRSGQQAVHSHNLFRLPAEGQIYVLMLAIMLLGALFGKTNTLMLIFALMAGPFIVNGGISFSMTRRLELKRALPGRVVDGGRHRHRIEEERAGLAGVRRIGRGMTDEGPEPLAAGSMGLEGACKRLAIRPGPPIEKCGNGNVVLPAPRRFKRPTRRGMKRRTHGGILEEIAAVGSDQQVAVNGHRHRPALPPHERIAIDRMDAADQVAFGKNLGHRREIRREIRQPGRGDEKHVGFRETGHEAHHDLAVKAREGPPDDLDGNAGLSRKALAVARCRAADRCAVASHDPKGFRTGCTAEQPECYKYYSGAGEERHIPFICLISKRPSEA